MREAYYDSKNLTPWDDLGALADDADYKENFCRAAEAVASVVRADGDRFLLEADRQATQFMLERDAAVAAAIKGGAQPPRPAQSGEGEE